MKSFLFNTGEIVEFSFIFIKYLLECAILSNFVQNYKEKVKELLPAIIIALITFLAPVLEKYFGKVKAASDAPSREERRRAMQQQQRQRIQVAQPKPVELWPEILGMEVKPTPLPEPVVVDLKPETLPEEGARVTVDKPVANPFNKPMVNDDEQLKPLHGHELRRAIIWGEILKRKF